jgi:hypothetical protein
LEPPIIAIYAVLKAWKALQKEFMRRTDVILKAGEEEAKKGEADGGEEGAGEGGEGREGERVKVM